MGKNRLEALSDNMFAVIATLLVFELRLPDGPDVWHSLHVLAPKIVAFVLSFLIVTMYWVAHHLVFDMIAKVDRGLLWLNSLSLMFLTFIPFPTAVLGSHPYELGAIALYGATLICVNVMNSLAWIYAMRTPGLLAEKVPGSRVRTVLVLQLLPAVLYVVAIALGLVAPKVSLGIFICVPLFYILPNPMFKWALRTSSGDGEDYAAGDYAAGDGELK